MAVLTVQELALTSSALLMTLNSCGGSGDTFANNGKTVVIAVNGSSASAVITFAATQTVTDAVLSVPDLGVGVATGTTRIIGPLPAATFNDSNAAVAMTYASSGSLTVAVVKWT
jgi:hypothetical protein